MTDYLGIAKKAMREREKQQAMDPERFIGRVASLKGRACELWRAGERYFIVADEDDARLVVERGMGSRGEVWTADEIERVATITDQGTLDEIERWKRAADGRVRTVEGAER